jgi:nicotinamidase/pyrazinamidase
MTTQADWKAPASWALVNVDPQNDFFDHETSRLRVPGSFAIIPVVNSLRDHFETVVFTQDWHPYGHKSFASTHGVAPFSVVQLPYGPQVAWPDHCENESWGAQFHDDIVVKPSDLIIRKGTNPDVDSYSAFYEADGKLQPRFDNDNTMTEELNQRGILTLVFTGLCRDICVADNVMDAVREGFNVILVEDGATPLNAEADAAKLAEMRAAGVTIVKAADLPQLAMAA